MDIFTFLYFTQVSHTRFHKCYKLIQIVPCRSKWRFVAVGHVLSSQSWPCPLVSTPLLPPPIPVCLPFWRTAPWVASCCPQSVGKADQEDIHGVCRVHVLLQVPQLRTHYLCASTSLSYLLGGGQDYLRIISGARPKKKKCRKGSRTQLASSPSPAGSHCSTGPVGNHVSPSHGWPFCLVTLPLSVAPFPSYCFH